MNHEDETTPCRGRMEAVPAESEAAALVIVDAAFTPHSNPGPGLLESMCEQSLAHDLAEGGLQIERQIGLPIECKKLGIAGALRLGFLVDDRVIVELTALGTRAPVQLAQILTTIRFAGFRLGFLVDFNDSLVKNGMHRVVV